MVGSRVYVGGLPYGTRERDLEKFFKGYGRTRDILIKNGYGFVEFEDYRDADDAVYELNGKELLGERSVELFIFSSLSTSVNDFHWVMLIYSVPMSTNKQGRCWTSKGDGSRFWRAPRQI